MLSVTKHAKESSGKLPGWFFFGLIPILLFPLFNLVPAPMILTGHPWKVELFFSVLVLFIFVIIGFTKESRKFFLENSRRLNFTRPGIFVILLLPFLLFILWSGLSAFWAPSGGSVLHHTLVWTAYLIFFVLCLISLFTSKSIEPIIVPIACIALILGLAAGLDLIGASDFSAVEGTFRIRYAKFAEMILTATPLLWALTLYSNNFRRSAFFLVAGIFAWLAVMFSLSRGAFLAGICGFLFFFVLTTIFSKKDFRRRTLRLGGLWLAITILTQIFFSFGSSAPATTDYLTGKNRNTDGNAEMRVYTWKVSRQMITDHTLFGVGADNFGLEFNESRANYALKNPSDLQNSIGEYYMFERTHNEFLQILAELGVIGALIFALFAGGFFYLNVAGFIRNSYRFSPVHIAALAGLLTFCISSLVSSFSFRAIQNGAVFFLVMAIALNEIIKIEKQPIKDSPKLPLQILSRIRLAGAAFGVTAMVLLFATSLVAGLSQYFVYSAENETDFSKAETVYQRAILLNPENASAYFSLGIKQLIEKQSSSAETSFRRAIDHGLGVTSTYSYLSTSQQMSGDSRAAEQTMREAVRIFPNSVFARVRFSVLLEQNGNLSEATNQLETAIAINKDQAIGWNSLIKNGSDATVIRIREAGDLPELSGLMPTNALFAILDDEIFLNRFPQKLARSR